LFNHLVYAQKSNPQEEIKNEKDAKMEWFREAKFGMFIHWGLYAIPDGEWKGERVKNFGEWIMLRGNIPSKDYEPLKDQFDPVYFDADQWVFLTKQAGMKYIAITTKHHDGFCLFDSKYTDYDIMSPPFKRDIIKELADASRRHGLKFGVYYSIPDWYHPEFPAEHNVNDFHGNPNSNADLEKYLKYMKNQITELFTNYGPISFLWFDGGASFDNMEQRSRLIHAHELVKFVHSLQPNCLINNRLGIPADYGTPEQTIPDTGLPGRDWETCMTMNNTWGYKWYDHKWKSSEKLVRNLVDIVSKGGNYLLNVGPEASGYIPQPSVERLTRIGKWTKVNGEAIYGTKPSPVTTPAWGRVTRKKLDGGITRLYLHVFEWPNDNELKIDNISGQAVDAFLLSDKQRNSLNISTLDKQITVKVPKRAPDSIVSVVALDIKGFQN
jgi:alpha-L-fucosidase